VKGYANKLLDNVNKIDENITMEDGTQCQTALESVQHRNAEIIIVVPEEAKSNADNLAILNEIAAEIEAETGVKVNITYRDKALD
jgi:maltose-binding protein MalE